MNADPTNWYIGRQALRPKERLLFSPEIKILDFRRKVGEPWLVELPRSENWIAAAMDGRYLFTKVIQSIDQLLNQGLYTVGETSRLTGVSTWRIRRWLRGYKFKSREKTYVSPPVWLSELPPVGSAVALGFRDLLEVRYVNAFINAGVSWPTIRKAHEKAAELLNASHPFADCRFLTDGVQIFLRLQESGQSTLLEVTGSQRVFDEIVQPWIKDLEFSSEDLLVRWWPMGRERSIVLDPRRSFGQPVVAQHGVPSRVLAEAAAKDPILKVAQWYEVTEDEVKDAVDYEQRLAA